MNNELNPSEGFSESGTPPPKRFKNVYAFHSAYKQAVQDDETSSSNRRAWRAMVDGEPPFDPSKLEEQGQAEKSNVDLGYGRTAIKEAEAGYYDLISSVKTLVRVHTNYGTQADRLKWQPIIAEGFTELLRRSRRFSFNYQLLVRHFVQDGVGVVFWENDEDWQFWVDSFENFKIPRGVGACEDELDCAFLRRNMRIHQLYKYVRDEESAVAAGWNIEAVNKVLYNAATSTGTKFESFEQLQRDLKNNDLGVSYGKSGTVKLVHGLVLEYDDSISHVIFEEESPTEYLFESTRVFDSMDKCCKIFTFGVGTNGDYHSVRGKGYEVFPFASTLNVLGNGIIDGGRQSTVTLIQPLEKSTRALDDLALTYYGPFGVVPPGFNVIERNLPNFSQNAIPAIELLTRTMGTNVGTFGTSERYPESRTEKTKFEVQAKLQKEATLSSAALDIFYEHLTGVYNELFRRVKRADYRVTEAGGRAVHTFRTFCVSRGVPLEAIFAVDRVEPVRGLGAGSAQQRILALDEALNLAPALPEASRVSLIRSRFAARFGYDEANELLPSDLDQMRQPIDVKISQMENAMMTLGVPIGAVPGENHFIHASNHMSAAVNFLSNAPQQGTPPDQVFRVLQLLMNHVGPHLQALQGDTIHGQEIAAMNKTYQQLLATLQRLNDALIADAKQQERAQQAEIERQQTAQEAYVRELEQKANSQQDPKIQMMLTKSAADIQVKLTESEAKQQIAINESQAKLQRQDAETAAKILSKA